MKGRGEDKREVKTGKVWRGEEGKGDEKRGGRGEGLSGMKWREKEERIGKQRKGGEVG